jgi:hypothetical protein
MNLFKFCYYWLLAVSWLITFFGLGLIIMTHSSLINMINKPVLEAFKLSSNVLAAQKIINWLYCVLGATMAGWGAFIWFVLKNAFAKKEKWSWFAIILSMVIWFIPDTIISALYGVYFNAMVNCLILIFIALPLSFVYHDFLKPSEKYFKK